MTIENTLERIMIAVEKIANNPMPVTDDGTDSSTIESFINPPAAAPVPAAAPMPNPATVTTTTVPFNDSQSLVQYVMGAYQEMGAVKGAKIQEVLNQYGYANINDVKMDHYAVIYQGIEALKAA